MAADEYLPTIGLEIHAELNTKTKMFCSSKNDAAEKRPNSNVCPVCMAHPGTLPVINKAAVSHVLRVGVALGAKLADYTEFDRKNYFYPDLPKGYQLSQFEYPLVSGGSLNGVKITRVHLEEDTASSIHLSTELGAGDEGGATLVDYNRAGVPLMELVTEPVLHTAEDAGNFGRELQLLLRYLGASEADMEKGQMRLEANISVAKIENKEFGIKNDEQKDKPNLNAAVGSAEKNNSNTNNSNTAAANTSNSRITPQNIASSDKNNTPANISFADKENAGTSSVSGPNANSSAALTAAAVKNDSSQQNRASEHYAEAAATNVHGGNERDVNGGAGTGNVSPALNADGSIDLSKLGTKVEVKNINSFRAMERAVQYEVKRQIALLERGEKVVQETRGWDENKQATFSQRIKEGSADYRYFPDPDLPSLKLSEIGFTADNVAKTLPELPWERRERYKAFGISTQDVELYVKDSLFGGFFEEVARALAGSQDEVKLASNYIANDLASLISAIRDAHTRGAESLDKMPISPANFTKLVRLVSGKKISSRSAKDLLAMCMDGVSDPDVLAKERNLLQESSTAQLGPTAAKLIAENPTVVADYKSGKTAALQFLIGQGMKELRGAADPNMLKTEFESQIAKMA